MKKFLISTVTACLTTQTYADDQSVSDFLSSRNKVTTIEYVAGMGEGMEFLNYRMRRSGRDPLFCVPPDLKLNSTNFLNIIESQIAIDPKKYSGLMPLASVMIDGLIRTFPCR